MQALEGIRVIDATQGMAGALTTMIFADFGAEVIRVEPAEGDPGWGNPAYLLWNRGKKSILLPQERAQVEAIVTGADVVLELYRPGADEVLGLGYERARTLNPALVLASLSAFGTRGPYRDLPAYDGIVNAKSGRMRDQVGHYAGRPVYRAVNDTSYHTAMFMIQGILSALRVAWQTGRGQRIETSLLHGVTAPNNPWRRFEGQELPPDVYRGFAPSADVLRGELVPDRREADPYHAIPSQLCTECKDGRWIMHAHLQLGLFKKWIETIGFSWIWDDPRYQGAPSKYPADEHRVELNLMILDRMREKTAAEWLELYVANPDCCGEIMESTQDALAHPQFRHNGHLIEVDDPRVGPMKQVGPFAWMTKTPAQISRPAPFPGQDTAQVLANPRPRPEPAPGGPAPGRPLEGIVVLELAAWLAAPFSGALLADLGARVIKVEPLAGDPFRSMPTNENHIRAMQGKESLAVDLKTPEGREILHRLVARADILMHNYRPGVPERLGMDYATLSRIKPDLVYVYAASYGSTGPHAARAAFNPTMGALTGNSVFQSGEGNNPIGDQSPDPISGSSVATAMLLGLAARLRTGQGQYLETTMMNSIVYCNSDDAFQYPGKPPRHVPDQLQLGLEATYRLYRAGAESWVFLAARTDAEFFRLCALAGANDIAADPRFASMGARYVNRAALGDALAQVFLGDTAVSWEARLTAGGVGCVQADRSGHRRFLHEDPHTTETGFMVPTAHPMFASLGTDGRYWRHAPAVEFADTPCAPGGAYVATGEHTEGVLAELGFSPAEIDRLAESDIVRRATVPAEALGIS